MEDPFVPPIVSICQVESNLPGEDRYCIRVTEDIYTYGVYDGHGGYLAADIACATLQDMIINEISSVQIAERNDTKIASIIDAAFSSCDEKIISEALRLHLSPRDSALNLKPIITGASEKVPSKPDSETKMTMNDIALIGRQQNVPKVMGRAGSCAAIVVITGGMLFVAHVGDCRVVLIRDENEDPSVQPSPSPRKNHFEEMFCGEEGRRKRQKLEDNPHSFELYDSLLGSLQEENRGGKTFRRREACPADFGSTYKGYKAEGITLDHSCDIQAEVDAVRHQSSDPNPIRCSDSDRKALGTRAPLRVAGSLAVTRAFGDSYLKTAPLSTPQYVQHIPYISCKPSIHYRPLRVADRAVIIASDGLWNFMKARDCARIMGKHLEDVESEENLDSHSRELCPRSRKIRDFERANNTVLGLPKFEESNRVSEERDSSESNTDSNLGARNDSSSSDSFNNNYNICSNNNQSSNSNTNNNSNNNNNNNSISIMDNVSPLSDSLAHRNLLRPPNSSPPNLLCSPNKQISSAKKRKEKKRKEQNKNKNKRRASKVIWCNQNIENLNFLFSLDSHIPVEALNYFNGFLPLVTATSNVAVTTTKITNTKKNTEKTKINTKCKIFPGGLFPNRSRRSPTRICSKDSSSSNGDNDIENTSIEIRNMHPQSIPISSLNGGRADEDGNSRNISILKREESGEFCQNQIQSPQKCIKGEEISRSRSEGSELGEGAPLSIVQVTCDIGDSYKQGAYTSHQVVRKECSTDSSDNILQIQAKACGGFESAPFLKVNLPQGIFIPGVNSTTEVDSRRFDPGFFDRKDKEGKDRRTSYTSLQDREKEREKESREAVENFKGDFLFDYYERHVRPEGGGDGDGAVYQNMQVSVNKGPALALVDKCLEVAAANSKAYTCGKDLRKVPQGPLRRGFVDDITVLVLTFQ